MSPQLIIVSCSQRFEEDRGELLLCQSFDHGEFARFAELDVVWGNVEGLSVVYNRKLNQYSGSGAEFVVFCHDDVYLDDLKLPEKLAVAHRSLGYQIIGVAGSERVNVTHPSLWHLMSERNALRGYMHHFCQSGQVSCTSFGPTPAQVVVIDGAFIAVHLPSMVAAGWKFNENYEFHHYDLASCIDAVAKGLKIGVYPIHMIHESPGLDSYSNPRWRASNEKFLVEYGNYSAGT